MWVRENEVPGENNFPRKLNTPHIKVTSMWVVAQSYNLREIKRILEGRKEVTAQKSTYIENFCQLVAEYNSLTHVKRENCPPRPACKTWLSVEHGNKLFLLHARKQTFKYFQWLTECLPGNIVTQALKHWHWQFKQYSNCFFLDCFVVIVCFVLFSYL